MLIAFFMSLSSACFRRKARHRYQFPSNCCMENHPDNTICFGFPQKTLCRKVSVTPTPTRMRGSGKGFCNTLPPHPAFENTQFFLSNSLSLKWLSGYRKWKTNWSASKRKSHNGFIRSPTVLQWARKCVAIFNAKR